MTDVSLPVHSPSAQLLHFAYQLCKKPFELPLYMEGNGLPRDVFRDDREKNYSSFVLAKEKKRTGEPAEKVNRICHWNGEIKQKEWKKPPRKVGVHFDSKRSMTKHEHPLQKIASAEGEKELFSSFSHDGIFHDPIANLAELKKGKIPEHMKRVEGHQKRPQSAIQMVRYNSIQPKVEESIRPSTAPVFSVPSPAGDNKIICDLLCVKNSTQNQVVKNNPYSSFSNHPSQWIRNSIVCAAPPLIESRPLTATSHHLEISRKGEADIPDSPSDSYDSTHYQSSLNLGENSFLSASPLPIKLRVDRAEHLLRAVYGK